jgi:tetratricopeptide (TPR) repeat protein
VLSLIDSLNFGLAKQALQKLVIDFSSEPDLPENLYWIARKYEWTNRYNDAKDIYEKIVQNYPDNDLLIISKAKIGIARMDACLFITSGNAEDANILVTKIKSDFIDNPVYANTLYEIARVYDYCKSIEQAERLHKAVVESSDIRLSSKASIEQAKLEIFRLIDNNDCIKFDDAIAKLRENFEDRPDLPETIQTIANKCAASGYEYESVGNYEKANWCFEQAISISKIVITEFHPSRELTPQAYYITAVCYQRLGDHEQAILNCQKALDDWPDNENSWRVLLTMAQSYEQMADAELISDEFASEQINIICDKLLSYSDFQANKAVHGLLKEWASSK